MRIEYNHRQGEFAGGGLHFLLIRKNASTSIAAALMANGIYNRDVEFAGERVAVWRRPRDRLLSIWRHYQRGLQFCDVPRGLTLEEFCEAKSVDEHLAPQWPVLKTCDRVLRFDRLEHDFEELRQDYPWIGPLPHLNPAH